VPTIKEAGVDLHLELGRGARPDHVREVINRINAEFKGDRRSVLREKYLEGQGFEQGAALGRNTGGVAAFLQASTETRAHRQVTGLRLD
jgi:hypothetical protein